VGGEAKRRRLAREAAGEVDDGFRVRIGDPAWLARKKEKQEVKGILLPVPASNRNQRRLGKVARDQVIRPLTADQIRQIHGPIRQLHEDIRAGKADPKERLEITTTEDEPHDPRQRPTQL
jgi:hypothetical protein